MKEANSLNLACRHCRFYQPQGRRGGTCQKLSVSVDGKWKACMLSSIPFENTIKKIDTNISTLEEIVHLETAFSLSYDSLKETCPKIDKSQKERY